MKVIKPTLIDSTRLVSSNAPDSPGYNEWDNTYTYPIGLVVWESTTNRMYRSLQDDNLNNFPPNAAFGSTWWIDIGPTNKYAMFDNAVGTYTTTQETLGTPGGDLEVVVSPGLIGAIALLELDAQSVRVAMVVGEGVEAVTVYEHEEDLLVNPIYDWLEYFFEPFVYRTEFVLTDLPYYGEATLHITVRSTSSARCGVMAVGKLVEVGPALVDTPTLGIVDYSRKYTDEFGTTTLIQRAYARKNNVRVLIENVRLPAVYKLLSDLRATPCVWLGSEEPNYYPLIVYGFYRDFSIEIPYDTVSFCNLEIEGLT